jgi:ribosomal protein S18 acetylase RimI-like enzyme
MDEITIRAAYSADAGRIASLDVDTWRSTYAGVLTETYLVGLSAERRQQGWAKVIQREPRDVRVAVDAEGTVLGFGSCGKCRAEPGFNGEVFTLYIDPDWHNRGIGRRLLFALFARLVAQGCGSVIIWVLQDNPARFFYERLGGVLVWRKAFTVGGKSVPALGYGWRDLPGFLAAMAGAEGGSDPEQTDP